MNRFAEILNEIANDVPKAQFENYLLRYVLKRFSDQDFDQKQAERFKHSSPDQIKEQLIQDILSGKDL